ncbi:hypothetical protein LCGC14_0795660 [marine sediment metagenome]|uniref:Uncharacterized protein n=1 Tax=marine sediment metagenome TaxID=412755 RepID=A0A0F9QB56_9ZZZZ
MGTAAEERAGKGCLGRAADDEPVFVLVAHDQVAAETVRDWAGRAQRAGVRDEKIKAAMEHANTMDAWRLANGGGKTPD